LFVSPAFTTPAFWSRDFQSSFLQSPVFSVAGLQRAVFIIFRRFLVSKKKKKVLDLQVAACVCLSFEVLNNEN